MMKQLMIGGIRVQCLSRNDWVNQIASDLNAFDNQTQRSPKVCFSVNGQVIATAFANRCFKQLLDLADYHNADGQSLVFASRLLCNAPLPERVATTDFFHDVAKTSSEQGFTFYLLGSTEKNLGRAVVEIKKQYPKLKIVGHHNGYFDLAEEDQIVASIRKSKPDILWVGMGFPRQVEFVIRNKHKLVGVGWIKTCGGLFDHFLPEVKRAPPWMQKAGLEWLFRMLQEPRKFFWRYLTTNPIALWLLLTRTRDL